VLAGLARVVGGGRAFGSGGRAGPAPAAPPAPALRRRALAVAGALRPMMRGGRGFRRAGAVGIRRVLLGLAGPVGSRTAPRRGALVRVWPAAVPIPAAPGRRTAPAAAAPCVTVSGAAVAPLAASRSRRHGNLYELLVVIGTDVDLAADVFLDVG